MSDEGAGAARNSRRGPSAASALSIFVCLVLVLPGLASGGDVSVNAVELISGRPSNFDIKDIAFNTAGTMAVAVGHDTSGVTSYHVWIYYPKTESWSTLSGWTSANADIYTSVAYDSLSSRFYFAGSSGVAGKSVGWISSVSSWGWDGTAASVSWVDLCVIQQNVFVAITPTAAYIYRGDYPAWFTIGGAMPPEVGVTLTSVAFNQSGGLVYVVGSTATGLMKIYYMKYSDLMNSPMVAYDASHFTTSPDIYQGLSAAWPASGYGLIGGNGHCYLAKPFTGDYDWRMKSLSVPRPVARYGAAFVYDPNNGVFVLFGGYTGTAYLDDTWEYNPYSNKWTNCSGAIRPTGRYNYDMVYDRGQAAFVLYGGMTSSGLNSQTWIYWAGNNTWYNYASVTGLPALQMHKMFYDFVRAGIIVYGGNTGSAWGGTYFFNWAGRVWTNLNPATPPPARYGHALAYSYTTNRAVMYGGMGGAGAQLETWIYDSSGNMWTQMATAPQPEAKYEHNLVYSQARDTAIMFGGGFGGVYDKTTWEWDFNSNKWVSLSSDHAFPGKGQMGAGMMEPSGRVVCFGGYNNTAPNVKVDVWDFGQFHSVKFVDLAGVDAARQYKSVAWNKEGTEAVFLADDGQLLRHVKGSTRLMTQGNPWSGTPNSWNSIAYKPEASPAYWAGVGLNQAIRLSTTSGQQNIQVKVEGARIDWVSMRTQLGFDMTNGNIDVDDGSGSTYYVAASRAWHNGGYGQISQVDLYMWQDTGLVGAASDAMTGASFDNAGSENLRIHFRWFHGNNTWWRVYPKTAVGGEETSLDLAQCYYIHDADGKNMTVYFGFSPHQQVRGTSATFTESAGTRYDQPPAGWNSEDQSTVNALNDAGTWDMKFVWWANTAPSAAYDEFGFYRYTYIGTSGVPGPLTGITAPGNMLYMTPQAHITFNSNTNYRLAAYVDSTLTGQTYSQQISTRNIGVMGGNLQNFTAPGTCQVFNGTGPANALYLLGSGMGAGGYMSPLNSGRTTSTAVGVRGVVKWRCWVPTVPEDTYATTVTYLLQRS